MLRKKTSGVAGSPQSSSFIGKAAEKVVDRRAFLRGSGLAIGGVATAAALVGSNVTPAKAAASGVAAEIKKSVCTHCSVGCTVVAEVQNGVWTGQEPGWDSPINLGAHCAKGASVRETASGERRLKYPMKLVGGKWVRMSWDDAINEIGDKMLDIRKKVWTGLSLLAWFREEQQRAGLSIPKALRLLGLQQRRPSGKNLSLNYSCWCC